MIKRDINLWQFACFASTSLLGTLLHFLYDWSGQSPWVAPFSGINESTWEHMKLLFFPLFLFALVQSLFFRGYPHFWCVKLLGSAAGLLLIPILFYTYNGAIGKSPDWLNISIFFVAAATAALLEARLLKRQKPACRRPWLPFLLLCLIGGLFILFTFLPPPLPLFENPF